MARERHRLTPDQERAWARRCAERKERERIDQIAIKRSYLIDVLQEGGVRDADLVVEALDRYLDARGAK